MKQNISSIVLAIATLATLFQSSDFGGSGLKR